MTYYYWGLTPNSWDMDGGEVAGFSSSPDWVRIEDDNLAESIEGATRLEDLDGTVQCSHPRMGYPNVYQSELGHYFAITDQADLEEKEDDDDDLDADLTLD